MKQNLLTSVVVATDFSGAAQLAFERALCLPLHPKGRVTLVHVVPDDIPGKLRKQAINESMRRLRTLLAGQAKLPGGMGVSPDQITIEVLEGKPAKQLAKCAKAVNADMVIIGRHGRRPVVDLFLGSTAQKIAREGGPPVLLVQVASDLAYQSVVAGLDLSAKPTSVLRATQLLAPASSVRAVFASQVPFEEYVTLSGEFTLSYRDELLADAKRTLAAAIAKSGVPAVPVVKPGDPRQVLLDEVADADAKLLVVGTHARKGLKRLFLGSVAEWVLSRAPCDVLVVRT